MTLITSLDDERLEELRDHTYCGKRSKLWPEGWDLATDSLRAVIQDRDDLDRVANDAMDRDYAFVERDAALERDECNKKNIDTLVGSCEKVMAQRNDLIVETAAQQAVINGLHELVDKYVAERDAALSREAALLKKVEDVDHVALVNESFDVGGWDNLTPGEKSMVRMTLTELRKRVEREE